jgi:PAS fold
MLPGESSHNTAAAQRHLSRIVESLQHSPTAAFILDSQYRITYCNPAWNRFATENGAPQLASDTVLGSNLFDAIPDVSKPAYSLALRDVLSTGLGFTFGAKAK